MRSPDHTKMTNFALLTLEHVLGQADHGPVPRSWGARLALTWLHSQGADTEDCKEFWAVMIDPKCGQSNEPLANICRAGSLSRLLERFYRTVGVQRAGMMYLGTTGKRSTLVWKQGGVDGDGHDEAHGRA